MTFTVINTETNIPFTVRIVKKGEKYGRDFCLENKEDKILVEFYDARYPHTEFGQFVSRYYLDTLLEGHRGGLNLEGSVPNWYIDTQAMQEVYFKLGQEVVS